MTKIYTTNTLTISASNENINVEEDAFVRLTAEVKAFWTDTSPAQRFLFYKWQESSDNGTSWRDIPSGQSENILSVNLPDNEKRYITSSIENQDIDIQTVGLNVADSVVPKSTLEFDKVFFDQNQYQYRCTAILYNNDTNTIESAATTNPITLNTSSNNLFQPNEPKFPWDPIDPKGLIEGGNIGFNTDTTLEIWSGSTEGFVEGTEWRITEGSSNNGSRDGVEYESGSIVDGVMVGIPTTYGPNTYSYDGYMTLQTLVNGVWVVKESWTSRIGNDMHTITTGTGSGMGTIRLLMNGNEVFDNINIGTEQAPTVIKPLSGKDGLGASLIANKSPATITDTQNVEYLNMSATAGIVGEQIITIPNNFVLPVQVTVSGGVDDDPVINGTVITDSSPGYAGGGFTHTFTLNDRTFTVAAYNSGGPAYYGYEITITATSSENDIDNILDGDVVRVDTSNILTIQQNDIALGDRKQVIKTIDISSTDSWQNTGIVVDSPAELEISAQGTVVWNNNGDTSDPNGVDFASNKIDNNFSHEALIGRIGGGTPFLVGSNYSEQLTNKKGLLELATNDSSRSDNFGAFTTEIRYSPQIKDNVLNFRIKKNNASVPPNPLLTDPNHDKLSLLVSFVDEPLPPPTPSVTPTNAVTVTPTATLTVTPSVTSSETPTPTVTPSVTASETPTPTPTISETPAVTPTPSSVLAGAQSCDSMGNCYYCAALFQADRIYGTFTVTGAGSVTYTDPDDANNPYNGTYDLNGTYSHIGSDYWGKDNFILQIENLSLGQFTLAINVVSNADLTAYGLGSYPSPDEYAFLEWLWTADDMSVWDIQNDCSSRTLSSSLFSLNSDGPENGYYHPGITLTGGAPTVVWNPDNTNRTICNNAGGVYAGVWHSSYPGGGFPTSTVEECLIYTLVPDADGMGSGGECATPSSPGGTYTFVSKNSYAGDTTNWAVSGAGTCCNGDCVTPFTDCSSSVAGDWGSC